MYALSPSEPEGSVCRLSRTCCSLEAQQLMQQSVSSDYHSRISNSISTRVFECYNQTLTGEESILYMVAVFLQGLLVRGWVEGWEGEGGGGGVTTSNILKHIQ